MQRGRGGQRQIQGGGGGGGGGLSWLEVGKMVELLIVLSVNFCIVIQVMHIQL